MNPSQCPNVTLQSTHSGKFVRCVCIILSFFNGGPLEIWGFLDSGFLIMLVVENGTA